LGQARILGGGIERRIEDKIAFKGSFRSLGMLKAQSEKSYSSAGSTELGKKRERRLTRVSSFGRGGRPAAKKKEKNTGYQVPRGPDDFGATGESLRIRTASEVRGEGEKGERARLDGRWPTQAVKKRKKRRGRRSRRASQRLKGNVSMGLPHSSTPKGRQDLRRQRVRGGGLLV